jgi:hypothetical protein
MNATLTKATILFGALILAAQLAACSPSLCARKDNWFKNHCAGTDVAYSSDPMCEKNLEHCDRAHLAQAQGYISCIESQNSCSLDGIAACGNQYPGGVNLVCTANQ